MKVPQCDWAPQLVVEWLSGELEERGIPGPTYAHTLLSLLHSQYCPHPPVSAGHSTSASTLSKRQHSRHTRDLNPRHLNLENLLLDDLPHPDADLPDLTPLTALKCGGSRRARKRFRVRQKHRTFTTEELQKVSALQCLMSASDEDLQHYDLENLVEELCTRLKLSREPKKSLSDDGITTSKTCASEESGNDTDDSTPEELAQRYFAAFPPLSVSCSESYTEDSSQKIKESCQCVWDGSTPVNGSEKCHNISTHSKLNKSPLKGRSNKKVKQEMLYKLEDSCTMETSPKPYNNFELVEVNGSGVFVPETTPTGEDVHDKQHSRFEAYIQDDIPEGYVGDTSSRESSEDRDKGDEIAFKKYNGKNAHSPSQAKKSGSWEEWECAANIDTNQKNSTYYGLPVPIGGGRLFERCSTSGGTSGCSSDVETGKTTPVQREESEEESLRLLERKISDTVVQIWGQSNDQQNLNYNSTDHVWNPPTMQDLASFNLGDIFMSRPPSVQLNPPQGDINNDAQLRCGVQLPECTNWSATGSLFLNPLLDSQKDPLFSSAFGCSPNHAVKSQREVKRDSQIWPDHNANETTQVFSSSKLPNINKSGTGHVSDNLSFEEQVKLCDSFQKLGLNQLWNQQDNSFTDATNSSGSLSTHINQDLHLSSEAKSDDIKELIFFDEEVSVDEASGRIDMDSYVKQIPSGPSGPHPVLKHTESSGFSTVVPRKSAELFPPDNLGLDINNSNSTSTSSIPGTFTKDATSDLVLPPTKEEENLLTSPRTHFKPIRQDSTGKKNEGNAEPNTIISGFQPPELAFQRTGSGALFLESDILEGSPKKYMVYREPLCKTGSNDVSEPPLEKKVVCSAPLIPKFKVVNNEKFSQTEREQCSRIEMANKREELKFKFGLASELEQESFKYESENFAGLSNIWKNDNSSHEDPENIWKLPSASASFFEMWKQNLPVSDELLSNSSSWLKDVAHLESWSTQDQFSSNTNDNKSSLLGGIAIPKPPTSEWDLCKSFDKHDPDLQPSFTSLKSIWSDYKEQKEQVSTNASLRNMELSNCDFVPFGDPSENKLWGPQKMEKEEAWSLQPYSFEHLDERSFPVCASDNRTEESMAKSDLDNETDLVYQKLFGKNDGEMQSEELYNTAALSNKSVSSLWNVHNTTVADLENNDPSGLGINPSLWDLPKSEGRIPNGAGDNATVKGGDDESEFLSHLWSLHQLNDPIPDPTSNLSEEQELLPIEDLDHLEPGWEMNEGFEWDRPHDDVDSDDGGCEVLIYEAEDGSTITVPVEYLDDTLYDEIFGSSDKPIGGSLPDLPSGNSMQVQLPRKSRGGRWLPPSRRPCSFFMEGNCKRPDCKFSHDLATITCRFWEEGSCLKGLTCPFLHGYPLKRQRNRSEGSVTVSVGDGRNLESFIHTSAFEIDSEADFPSLSSSVESKRTTPEECMIQLVNNGASSKSKKKNKFITITRNIIGEGKPSGKTCRFLRRRAARRQRGQQRSGESKLPKPTSETEEASQPLSQTEKKSAPVTIKKLERHRATASGHEDGTVSDY